ncbi:MAG: hypothetical protein KIT84_24095 [Labilithrix sp.]|nr:hypothetical protein [Labilithrix sp.]MCW5814132.1 hypothetical protein [Labilithrix sp.]
MDDSQNDEGFTGRPSSADAIDLLDLVRGAEEAATLSASSPDAEDDKSTPPRAEEFVDVGDEAVDLPPSLPPMRVAEPRVPSVRPRAERPRPVEDVGTPMSPALAIVLVVLAVIGALYALLALPPLL